MIKILIIAGVTYQVVKFIGGMDKKNEGWERYNRCHESYDMDYNKWGWRLTASSKHENMGDYEKHRI